jgi:isopenicillin N synthase-like dioxygenase
MRQVPELDLYSFTKGNKSEKKTFSKLLFSGLKDYGFIVLTGHTVSTDLLDEAYRRLDHLFALSESAKRKYSMPDNGHQRGYTPFAVEHAKNSKIADLKEFWHIGREGFESDTTSTSESSSAPVLKNFWPTELEGFKKTFLELYTKLDQVGLMLLQALTSELELDASYFYDRVANGNSILRLLHYPPLDSEVEKGALRAAPHEDINLITILVAATQSGLQLKDRDGSWLDIEAPKNSLIVDAGDMLSRITNEVIPSTTHQVINPDGSNEKRYSMPFFMHPNSDAVLECLPSCVGEGVKYPPITSDSFLKERLKEIGL